MRMIRPTRAKMALWFTLYATVLWSGQVSAQEPVLPEEYVAEVMRHHPSLERAEHLVQAADFALKASRLQPNPTLTLAATAGDAGESSNALNQSFEISGQPHLRWQMADLRLQMARLERDSSRRTIAAQAFRAWLACWRDSSLSELSRLRVRLMEDTLRAANRRYEVGEIAQNEALRVELAAARARASLTEAQADWEASSRELELLLNRQPDRQIQPVAELPPDSLLRDIDYPNVMDAVAYHPQLRARRLGQKALELGAQLTGKERAPSLNLSLYRADLFRTGTVEQGAQLSLSWPLFDWGRVENRKQQQEAQARAETAEVDRLLLERRRRVSRLWSQLQAARTNRDLLIVQAARYEELAREGRVAYDLGMVSLTDALQTEASFRAAGVELVEARAQVLELEIQLLELTGLAWPGITEEDSP